MNATDWAQRPTPPGHSCKESLNGLPTRLVFPKLSRPLVNVTGVTRRPRREHPHSPSGEFGAPMGIRNGARNSAVPMGARNEQVFHQQDSLGHLGAGGCRDLEPLCEPEL